MNTQDAEAAYSIVATNCCIPRSWDGVYSGYNRERSDGSLPSRAVSCWSKLSRKTVLRPLTWRSQGADLTLRLVNEVLVREFGSDTGSICFYSTGTTVDRCSFVSAAPSLNQLNRLLRGRSNVR